MAGYHITEIPKGTHGLFDKILEEAMEFVDANKQNCKIMELVELSDLYGAIEAYLQINHPTVTMDDLKIMSDITKRAFKDRAYT